VTKKQGKKPSPIDIAQLGATIAVGKSVQDLEEKAMVQFDALNNALDALSTSVDDLTSRLESATSEDPATQAAIDEAVARINEVQSRIDALHPAEGDGSEPQP
jgi:peptidoglycan hydrolase CwlO-like protein